MIEAFTRALYTFWSGFGVPAYIAGQVADGAQFPYITYEVTIGAFASFNFMTATVWCKGESANAQRAALLDAIAEAIPDGGHRINTERGAMVLYRNAASFVVLADDPTDSKVVGGRIGYQANYYGQ